MALTPIIQYITLDLASANNFNIVKGVQGDSETRYVYVTLLDNGLPYTLNCKTIAIRGTKPDGKGIFNYCTLSKNNEVIVELDEQILAVPGRSKYEIALFNVENANEATETLTTFPFYIVVDKASIDAEVITSTNEFKIISDVMGSVSILQSNIDIATSASKSALESKNAAATSASNALTSEKNSKTSETNALSYKNSANTSATNAKTSETNAKTSESNALSYKNAAATSATNAKTSEDNAASSEATAVTSATNAKTSENNAKTSETNALSYKNAASTSEKNALLSQNAASTSEKNAKTSETNAASSESIAITKAGEASTSATKAATSEKNASTSESNAKVSEENTKTSESNAKTSETNAATSESNALSYKNAANTSETNAKTSETNAKTSELNAKTSEINAASSASIASTKANEASTSLSALKTVEQNVLDKASEVDANAKSAASNAEKAQTAVDSITGCLKPKGTIVFANIPTTDITSGDMYNISNNFTSDTRFKDGGSIDYPAGTNIYYTSDGKWDCLAGELGDYVLKDELGNQIINYTIATSDTALISGDKISVLFGKLARIVNSFISHVENAVSHITSSERTNWNAAYSHSKSTNEHIPSGGESGQFLKLNSDGQATWDSDNNTTYSPGTGISLSGTTFSNSGVRSIATGSSNGTISVNTNGTSANVAVKGLGSAAYTESDDYAASNHTHDYLPLSGGDITGNITIGIGKKIQLYQDDEGGNIAIFSPNGQRWEIDAINNTQLRIFSYGSSTNGNAVKGISIDENGNIGADGVFNGSISGNAASASAVAWGNVTGKPSTFTPSSHTHDYLPLSGGTVSGYSKYNNGLQVLKNSGTGTYGDGNSTIEVLSTNKSTNPSICFHKSGVSHVGLGVKDTDGVLYMGTNGNLTNVVLNSGNYTSYCAKASHSHDYIPTSASCNKNWNWSAQDGQPPWMWGGNDGTNMYVYNPSNFSVNYANSAGSVAWGNVTGKPSTFTPSSHTHDYLPLSGGTLTGVLSISTSAQNVCQLYSSSTESSIVYNCQGGAKFTVGVGCGGTGMSTFAWWYNAGGYNAATLNTSGQLYVKNGIDSGGHIFVNGHTLSLWSGSSCYIQGNVQDLNLVSGGQSDSYVNARCGNSFQVRDVANNLWKPIGASAFNVQSSRKYKKNIEDISEERARELLKYRVVKYDYINEGDGVDCIGLIAEEVAEIEKYPVSYRDGEVESLDYSKFTPQLIKMVQLQQKEIEELKKRLDEKKIL